MPRATPFKAADVAVRVKRYPRPLPSDTLAELARGAGIPDQRVSEFAKEFQSLRSSYQMNSLLDEQETPARVAAALVEIAQRLDALANATQKSRQFQSLKSALIEAPMSVRQAFFSGFPYRVALIDEATILLLPESLHNASEVALAAANSYKEKSRAHRPMLPGKRREWLARNLQSLAIHYGRGVTLTPEAKRVWLRKALSMCAVSAPKDPRKFDRLLLPEWREPGDNGTKEPENSDR
jgi:hypothetical protein